MKRIFNFIILVVAALGICMPAFAMESQSSELKLYLQYHTSQGNAPFLMAEIPETLFGLQEGEKINPEKIFVSTDGQNYRDITDRSAIAPGAKLNQPCLLPNDPVLLQYSNQEIDTIYISAVLSKCDASGGVLETKTISGCWKRPVLDQDTSYRSLEREQLKVMSVSKILQLTGTTGEAAALPERIPVILGFKENPPENNVVWLMDYSYPVSWEDTPISSENGKAAYQLKTANSPSEETDILTFYYKDQWYQVSAQNSAFPEIIMSDLQQYRLPKCIVNLVEPGYVSPITLTLDETKGDAAIGVRLPYKPTKASKIEAEVSTDGGTTWRFASEIDLEQYPVDANPEACSFQAMLFSEEQAADYSREGNGGFRVRLKIYGGPLGNAVTEGIETYTITQTANWPSGFVSTPPKEPTGDYGSGGNKGDVGTDNSGSTEGVRPSTENVPETDPPKVSESVAEPEVVPVPEPVTEPESVPVPEIVPEPEPESKSEPVKLPKPEETTEAAPVISQNTVPTEQPKEQESSSAGLREKEPILAKSILLTVSAVLGVTFLTIFIRRYRR